MSDNTIDILSIEINSSSKGASRTIDSLIRNLARLNGSLENYSDTSGKYGKALSSLENGLSNLNNAISSVNADNLKSVAKSISSLSSSAKKLSGAFSNTGMDKAARDAKALDNQINHAVQHIMSYFGTSGKATQQVKEGFSGILSSMKIGDQGEIRINKSAFEQASGELKSVLENSFDASGVFDGLKDEYQQYINYIKNTKVPTNLPFDWKDAAGDYQDFLRQVGTLGIGKFTTGNAGGKGDISEYVSEFNDAFGTSLDVSSDTRAFQSLVDFISQARAELKGFSDATVKSEISTNEFISTVQSAWQSVMNFKQGIASAESQLNSGAANMGSNSFVVLSDSLKNLPSSIPDLSGVSDLALSVGELGKKKAVTGIQNLPLLANGLQSLSSLSIPEFPNLDGLAKLIDTFNKLGGKRGSGAAINIQPMISGIKQLSQLNGITFPDASGLTALANAFSALGRKTTGQAIENIPKLATAFKGLMKTLSTAPRVSSNVIALANAMAKLSANGNKVAPAVRGLESAFDRISTKAKSISSRIIEFGKNLLLSGKHADSAGSRYSNLASKIGLLYAKFWVLLRAVRSLNGMIEIASALTEVQNVVDTTFGNMSGKLEDFAQNSIKNFGMSELSAKQFASQFQAMGTAMGITGAQVKKATEFISTKRTADGLVAGYNEASNSMADMSINLTKLAADMASFYDIEQSTVAKALQSGVMAGQTRPLKLAA